MASSSKADTKSQIMDAAELHFATYGFAGTTLRGIIKDAKVNVAAVAYHFGTKEELYAAVVERFATPVVSAQLTQLREVCAADTFTLEDVLRTFYAPPLTLIQQLGKKSDTLSLFLGRSQTEPEPVYTLVDKHFAACRQEYISAFKTLWPHMSEADAQWKFEFMLSLIVCFLTRQRQIRARYETETQWKTEEVLQRLISFCTCGFAV